MSTDALGFSTQLPRPDLENPEVFAEAVNRSAGTLDHVAAHAKGISVDELKNRAELLALVGKAISRNNVLGRMLCDEVLRGIKMKAGGEA